MSSYLHPGVYVEEIPSGSKSIEGVGTSVAAFVGFAIKGPIGEPTLISKWDDYDDEFGGIQNMKKEKMGDPMGLSVSAFYQNGGSKAYIVRITEDWEKEQSSIAHAEKAVGYLDDPSDSGTGNAIKFTAVNEGTWANGIIVKMSVSPIDSRLYDVEIGRNNDKDEFFPIESFTGISLDPNEPLYIKNVIDDGSEFVTVDFDVIPSTVTSDDYLGTSTSGDLSTLLSIPLDLSSLNEAARTLTIALDGNPTIPIILPVEVEPYDNLAAVAKAIEDKVTSSGPERRKKFTCMAQNNKLILTSGTRKPNSSVEVTYGSGIAPTLKLGIDPNNPDAKEKTGQQSADDATSPHDTLDGGADGGQPGEADYVKVFTKFIKYRDINIICLPGQYWSKDNSGNSIIQKAIGHAEKMKSRMIIVDLPPDHELDNPKKVKEMELPSQTYCVVYYPWIEVANRFYHAERYPGLPKTILVPPSGYSAGMWAKIDGKRGVWKAPAGTETGLLGLAGLQYKVEDAEQDSLNPWGINCFRSMPGSGKVIWGSRTLATKADPEWRYVPVRRTAIFIEQSIYEGIQWAVFEPNDHRLWAALRGNIGGFMNGLFRVGAFQGEKATDAYFVRCNLDDTMTQTDIDTGKVIVIVGFAPLKPAEFVIVRIQQKVNLQ